MKCQAKVGPTLKSCFLWMTMDWDNDNDNVKLLKLVVQMHTHPFATKRLCLGSLSKQRCYANYKSNLTK